MIEYLNGAFSPNCLKTAILLRELGLAVTQVDLTREQVRAPAFRERVPNAKLPVVVDDGVVIAESTAIALYLAGKHGKLMPRTAEGRARMYQALAFEAALQAPVIGGMGIFGELGRPERERDTARIERLMPEAARIAGVLGAVLGDREYFAGEPTIADIQLWPGASKAIAHGVYRDPPANLVAWERRVAAWPSVRAAREHYDGFARA